MPSPDRTAKPLPISKQNSACMDYFQCSFYAVLVWPEPDPRDRNLPLPPPTILGKHIKFLVIKCFPNLAAYYRIASRSKWTTQTSVYTKLTWRAYEDRLLGCIVPTPQFSESGLEMENVCFSSILTGNTDAGPGTKLFENHRSTWWRWQSNQVCSLLHILAYGIPPMGTCLEHSFSRPSSVEKPPKVLH